MTGVSYLDKGTVRESGGALQCHRIGMHGTHAVPAGYATFAHRGHTCRYVTGVCYRAATYQGQTIWVVVQ